MDSAYLSTVAALAGSTIGGLTSLGASWLTQHTQFKTQQLSQDRLRREELYSDFIDEAARLYADAYEHNEAAASKMVKLFALVSRMRVLSSPGVVDSADRVIANIIETYLGPNKTFREIPEVLAHAELNPLLAFSNACRDELRPRRFL
jgi:hypothetical protein